MSKQKQETIMRKLHQIGSGEWNGHQTGVRDVLNDAVRQGIFSKDSLAQAFGCQSSQINRTIMGLKAHKVKAGMQSLGFGDNSD